MASGAVVIVGGTSGIGLRLAETYAARGRDVVITGRDADRCAGDRVGIAGRAPSTPVAFDLAEPETIAAALEPVGPVEHLVLAAIERDYNHVARVRHRARDPARDAQARRVHRGRARARAATRARRLDPALRRPGAAAPLPRLDDGDDRERRRLRASSGRWPCELAPIRVNAIHPGIVGDSPEWAPKTEAVREDRVPDADRADGHDGRDRRRLALPARERRRERQSTSRSTAGGTLRDGPRRRRRPREDGASRSPSGSSTPAIRSRSSTALPRGQSRSSRRGATRAPDPTPRRSRARTSACRRSSDDAALEAVLLGEGGLLGARAPGHDARRDEHGLGRMLGAGRRARLRPQASSICARR